MKAPRSQRHLPHKRHASKTRQPRPGQWTVWLLVPVVAVILGIWWQTMRPGAQKPPQVPLSSLEASLAGHIQAARSNVLAAPRSADAWGKFGEALHVGEFHSEARLCYSNAAVLDPRSFRWPYLLARLQLQEQPDAALRNFQRATELAGNETDSPRFELARALVERGRYDDAYPHLQILLAGNSNHVAARVELARIYVARRAFKEATAELQSALTNSHTMRAATLLAVQMAQRNGQPEIAAQLSRRAANLPRDFDWPDPVLRDLQTQRLDRTRLADQANTLLQQQRLPDAEVALTQLLNAFPNDPEGLLLFGRLRFQQRRCTEAETSLRRHLEVQPNSLNGLIQLSLSLLCQERWAHAVAVLEKAIALKPDFAQAHSNLGTARSRLGDSAGAIRAFRDALRCNPGDVNAHFALAEELANAGELAAAKEHIQRAAAINPNDPRLPAARQQLGLPP